VVISIVGKARAVSVCADAERQVKSAMITIEIFIYN
jgi:hypothetical protein